MERTNKEMYVVFETDEWLSVASKQFMGVFTSKDKAIKSIVENHSIDLCEILDSSYIDRQFLYRQKASKSILRKELEENGQTQGYSINYMIEPINKNEWYHNC